MPNLSIGARWIATLALVALIVLLSVVPGQPKPDDSSFAWLIARTPSLIQKLMHFVIYGALAFLWSWTLESVNPRWLRIGAACVLAVGLGAALEWYQTRVPGRFGTLMDVLLNAAGAIAGLAAALLLL